MSNLSHQFFPPNPIWDLDDESGNPSEKRRAIYDSESTGMSRENCHGWVFQTLTSVLPFSSLLNWSTASHQEGSAGRYK